MNAAIRWVVITLLVVHGLIHMMRFSKERQLAGIKALTDRTIVPVSETTLHKPDLVSTFGEARVLQNFVANFCRI